MHQDHPLVDHGGTLVEVLAVEDLVLQTITEHPQQVPHIAVVGADSDLVVLELWGRGIEAVCGVRRYIVNTVYMYM